MAGVQLPPREETDVCSPTMRWSLAPPLVLGLILATPWLLGLLPRGSSLVTPLGELHAGPGAEAYAKANDSLAQMSSMAAERTERQPGSTQVGAGG